MTANKGVKVMLAEDPSEARRRFLTVLKCGATGLQQCRDKGDVTVARVTSVAHNGLLPGNYQQYIVKCVRRPPA